MRRLLLVVLVAGCGSDGKSMPPVAKRNFDRATKAAEAALAGCAKLYAEPHGCFGNRGPQEFRVGAPSVAIEQYWSGDKSDVLGIEAACLWSNAGFAKMFQLEAPTALGGSPTCSFRPYPKPDYYPPSPEGKDCMTMMNYNGWKGLDDKRKPSENILVPRDEDCAGAWEAIEVRRSAPDAGVDVTVTVWLKGK